MPIEPFLEKMYVFDEQIQFVASEVIDQAIHKFNQDAAGGILLINNTHKGDYIERARYHIIENLIQRRDAYSDGPKDPIGIDQIEQVSVKIDGRLGPILWSGEQFRRIGETQEVAGTVIGIQSARAILQDYLNTTVMCAIAAANNQDEHALATNQASVVTRIQGQTINLLNLNLAKSRFGDRSNAIVCWLMHSKCFHDLIGHAIQNHNRLFDIGTIKVMEIGTLNSRFIVSDIPQLQETVPV